MTGVLRLGLWFILMAIFAMLFSACVPFTDDVGNRVSFVKVGQRTELASETIQTVTKMKAQVKGSIYETGEQVSVFGTCLNSSDMPLVSGTYAMLNSWYPNGTIFFQNASMSEIQPGYYVYIGTMNAVQGTYLTELICHVNGSDEIAKAWGEWQNPYWVERIGLLNDSLTTLETNIYANFTTTWNMINQTDLLINQTFQNLTSQITIVGQIANASVDRNDSYLAQLLLNLHPPVSNSSINYTESADSVDYWTTWHVTVSPYSSLGKRVSDPDAYCTMNTTLTSLETLTPSGLDFIGSVFINQLGDFSWTIQCYYS